jgi:cell fate regulator YaaT (PSP1 superfamily)
MADGMTYRPEEPTGDAPKPWQLSVEQAREQAKERFRERIVNGEQVGGCSCSSEDEHADAEGAGPHVVGVRFRDSGRVYFFESGDADVEIGTWVACTTSRGQEAARVVIAPRQVLMSQLDGDLKPIDRIISDEDSERIEEHRTTAGKIVRRGGEISRSYDFGVKVIAAEFSLDGGKVRISYSAQDHSYVEDLRAIIADEFGVDAEMVSVGPRDEARLIGGLGKCGRTLCCSSWLPIYPDVTMGMVKNQDLSLNPTKVSGLCGRLLCCLSYENEQYKKAKQILPRLGQRITTDEGEGIVVSLQVLKELITVRYANPHREVTYPAADILSPRVRPERVKEAPEVPAAAQPVATAPAEQSQADEERPRRRRRRRNRHSGGNVQSQTQS